MKTMSGGFSENGGWTVGQYVNTLMSNNPRLMWDELKRLLEDYYGVVSNANACILELANVKRGRTDGAQDYIHRVVHIAPFACITVDEGSQVVRK